MSNKVTDGKSTDEYTAHGRNSNKTIPITSGSDSNFNAAAKSESNEKEKLWSMLLTQNQNTTNKKDLLSTTDNKPNNVVATFMKNVVSNEKLIENDTKENQMGDISNESKPATVDSIPNDGIKFIKAMGKSINASSNIIQKPSSTDCNSDSDGCTDTLKKWLRISSDQSTSSSIKSVSQDLTNATTSINLEDMFKVDTYTLPKPPQTWRTDSVETKPQFNHVKQKMYPDANEKKLHNKSGSKLFYASPNTQYNNSAATFHQNMHIPPPNQNLIHHPQPKVQQRYPVPPPHIFNRPPIQPSLNFYQQPPLNFHNNSVSFNFIRDNIQRFYKFFFFLQNSHQLQQGPNGPQNLSYNSVYSPGQGAFIPLQAVRQNFKVRPIHIQQSRVNFCNSFMFYI